MAAATAVVVTTALVGTTLPDLVADRASHPDQQSQGQNSADSVVVTELPEVPSARDISSAQESSEATDQMIGEISERLTQANQRALELDSAVQIEHQNALAAEDEAEELATAAAEAEEAQEQSEDEAASDASEEYQEGEAGSEDILLEEDSSLADEATEDYQSDQAEQEYVETEQEGNEYEALQEQADAAAEERDAQYEAVEEVEESTADDVSEVGQTMYELLEALAELEDYGDDIQGYFELVLGNADFLNEDGSIDEEALVRHLSAMQADAEQARVSEEDIEEGTADEEDAPEEEPEASEEETEPVLVSVEAEAPSQEGNLLTVPEVEGVSYSSGSGQVEVPEDGITIEASAEEGHELSGETSWTFDYQAPEPEPEPEPEPQVVSVEAEAPSQEGNLLTVPEVEGVSYSSGSGQVEVPEDGITIEASAEEGHELSGETSWTFDYQAPEPVIHGFDDLSVNMQTLMRQGAEYAPDFGDGAQEYYQAVLANDALTNADGNASWTAMRWHVEYLREQHEAAEAAQREAEEQAAAEEAAAQEAAAQEAAAEEAAAEEAAAEEAAAEEAAAQEAAQQEASQSQTSSGGSGGSSPAPATSGGGVEAAIEFAVAQANNPNAYYQLGANGPNGWDCSSLIQQAYAQAGISLGRTTYDQINQGTTISVGEAQRGDLIFWGDWHAAIYLGDGQIVDAGSPSSGVSVRSMFGSPTSAVRL
ncbi:C40 family peptidase [Nesterenkonia cremea]|uniref:C40 family peptidase n=1 Tax=Nesterenkonia cremea TaxID=1882340 RepID=UPI001E421D6E|nr:C40 family peptidase [Nesterenkonia cremea]